MTTATNESPSTGLSIWMLIGSIGLLLSSLAILLGLVLPFFYPPASKWTFFYTLYQPVWWPFGKGGWQVLPSYPLLSQSISQASKLLLSPVPFGLIVGPILSIVGLLRAMNKPSESANRGLQQVVGAQLLLGGTIWLLWHIVQLSQSGWLILRQGVYKCFMNHPSLIGAPILLAIGSALLTQPKCRTQAGIVLAALAYHLALICSFYLYISLVVTKQFPLRFRSAPATEIAFFQSILFYAVPVCFLLGTLLLSKSLRLRFHLLMTVPIWLPFFVVFFFWSLILNTTLYFLEDITGIAWQPPAWLKITLLSWLCLPLFPLLLSIDFCISLVRYLGGVVLNAFFPIEERAMLSDEEGAASLQSFSPLLIHTVGTILLCTAPIWLLPVFVYWGIRLFIYESILLPLFGRPQTPHQRTTPQGEI